MGQSEVLWTGIGTLAHSRGVCVLWVNVCKNVNQWPVNWWGNVSSRNIRFDKKFQ